VFLLTIGNETHESIKAIPTVEGVEIMIDFLNMFGLVSRFITHTFKEAAGTHEVDNTEDEEFRKFMHKQGVKLI
jgi:hypothetical protein